MAIRDEELIRGIALLQGHAFGLLIQYLLNINGDLNYRGGAWPDLLELRRDLVLQQLESSCTPSADRDSRAVHLDRRYPMRSVILALPGPQLIVSSI